MMKILFIVTSATSLAGSPTGVWFEELSTPYYILQDAGYEVDIVSLEGGEAPFDPRAFEDDSITESVKRFKADKQAMVKVKNSGKIADTNFLQYDAIFFPGGHGAVVDLPFDKILAEKTGKFFDSGKPVAAICHGPGGLVEAKRDDGKSIVYGLKVTAFSNAEEEAIGVTDKVPFLLESRLSEIGGKYESGENFGEFVVEDGNLITGQNPASSAKIAKVLLEKLKN